MKSAYYFVNQKYNEYFNFKCEPHTFEEKTEFYDVNHIKELNNELVKQHLEYRKAQSLTCCNDVVDALF